MSTISDTEKETLKILPNLFCIFVDVRLQNVHAHKC